MLKPISSYRRLNMKTFKLLADSINLTTTALHESLEEYDVDMEEECEIYILESGEGVRLGVLAPAELAGAPEVMGPAAVYAGGRWYYSARFRLIYPTTEA